MNLSMFQFSLQTLLINVILKGAQNIASVS